MRSERGAEQLPPQLLDLELQMRDQRLVVGQPGLRRRRVGFGRKPPLALDDQRRLQRFDVVGNRLRLRVHDRRRDHRSRDSWRP